MSSIFNDPVEWARKAAGTPVRFWSILAFQVVVGGAVAFTLLQSGNIFVGMLAVLFAITYPAAYLYALRQLLSRFPG